MKEHLQQQSEINIDKILKLNQTTSN